MWMALAVALAVAVVTTATVDIGPSLRGLAERRAAIYLKRQVHIGHLSIKMRLGTFVLEDFVIGGLTDADRPFLRAKRIAISLPWWTTLTRREILLESVEMSDWEMLVEMFPDGVHNFPRFMPDRQTPAGPRRFVTTIRRVDAIRGQFTYEDHGTPWSTVARNLEVRVWRDTEYRGEARFSGGTVQIQAFEPMAAAMETAFTIDGAIVRLAHIDLHTDGAESKVTGEVDLGHWPEQIYQVQSRVVFRRMRELFWARESWTLAGEGDFAGTFHLFKGGRELRGRFESDEAGVNTLRLSRLSGDLEWLPERFAVTDASAGFHGGAVDFSYSLVPLGRPNPATARFDVTYRDVDLIRFSDYLELRGIRLNGLASGRNHLEWPLGRFAANRGEGTLHVDPPPGVRLMTRVVPAETAADFAALGPETLPFDSRPTVGYTTVGGDLAYAFDPESVVLAPGTFATSRTYVEFEGETAWGERSRIPFHVTSGDWQESDRLLAGLMTAFGARTRAIPIAGSGTFDGEMTGAFRDPRIEGRFVGERMYAWDVLWGRAEGHVVVENSYANVSELVMTHGDSAIRADGRFSLVTPRRDVGDEIDTSLVLTRRPVAELRHAFGLDDYDVDGLVSGELRVLGRYRRPEGFGRVTIENGVAYGEAFESAAAGIRLEGETIRIEGLEVDKSGGRVTGAAEIGWNGTYSFNADGRGLLLESINAAAYPQLPLTGVLEFSASGNGTFEAPRYDVRGRILDLFVADEGVGQVVGQIGVRGEVLTLQIEAASPRLAVSVSGRMALTPEVDADISVRFVDTSLDPYVRFLVPKLSPFTTAVASGGLSIVGELRNPEHLRVDATVDKVTLRLFDYQVTNDGPLRLVLDRYIVRSEQLRMAGEGTGLELLGQVDLENEQVEIRVNGDANLGILQGFFRDIRSSGAAQLRAEIRGPMRAPLFAGEASITNGRIRHFSLPHSVEAINGRMTFDAGGVAFDDVVARLGGGDLRLGGRVGLDGYVLDEVNITAVGQRMELRYPQGMRSVVDADLTLRGSVSSLVLGGTIRVRSAVWSRRFDAGADLFGFGTAGTPAPAAAELPSFPLEFDIRIVAPSTMRIDNNAARIVASADLTLRGSYDRPLLFGRAEIDRGQLLFEGRRYFVSRGTIDFANPVKIEPFFDVEVETRVRAPGETYRVTIHIAGTTRRFVPDINSDPPLPTADVLALVFGDVRDPRNAELEALRSPNVAAQELLQARATRLLATPIVAGVGRAVEETFRVDTVQITPSLAGLTTDESSRLTPTARLTIGKRISDRLYLTYSRGLAVSSRDQIILLEYDQSDRISWVLSQNEDQSYALDFRVRHVF